MHCTCQDTAVARCSCTSHRPARMCFLYMFAHQLQVQSTLADNLVNIGLFHFPEILMDIPGAKSSTRRGPNHEVRLQLVHKLHSLTPVDLVEEVPRRTIRLDCAQVACPETGNIEVAPCPICFAVDATHFRSKAQKSAGWFCADDDVVTRLGKHGNRESTDKGSPTAYIAIYSRVENDDHSQRESGTGATVSQHARPNAPEQPDRPTKTDTGSAPRKMPAKKTPEAAVTDSQVDNALGPGGDEKEELATINNIKVTRGHMRCLKDREWLVDEVVNFYLENLQQCNKDEKVEAFTAVGHLQV